MFSKKSNDLKPWIIAVGRLPGAPSNAGLALAMQREDRKREQLRTRMKLEMFVDLEGWIHDAALYTRPCTECLGYLFPKHTNKIEQVFVFKLMDIRMVIIRDANECTHKHMHAALMNMPALHSVNETV